MTTGAAFAPSRRQMDEYLKRRGWDVDSNGCWVTRCGPDTGGYGQARIDNVKRAAHIFAYLAWVGDIPKGMYVLHHCDNPPCINPEHLYAGTPQQNMDDKMARHRHVSSPGQKNGMAKLTEEQVLAIRSDTRSQREIAAAYGIQQMQVSRIKRRERWAWL